MSSFLISILTTVCLTLRTTAAFCPQVCICDTDERAWKRVHCDGGISIPDSVDIQSLDQDVKVLIVSGARQNPNSIDLQPAMFSNKRFREIRLSHSNLERLLTSPFRYVSNTLQVLSLTHNRLAFAVEQNFRNLSRLTHLHLDYNRIEPVFSGMFNFLGSLKVLTMSNNIIREIPPRMMLQLDQLEVLDLSSNPLGEWQYGDRINVPRQTIPDTIFQDLPNLRILRVANTSLDSLPWEAIAQSAKNLQEIDLSNNRLRIIKTNQLSLLRDLKVVRLAGNPITSVEHSSFAGLSLDHLDLSGLSFKVLTKQTFFGANIRFLDISDMFFNVLDRDVFMPVSQELQGLNISRNPDLLLQSRMFEIFPNLENLTMTRMEKSQLPNDLFAYPNKLKILDLSENELVTLEEGFFSTLNELMHLNLASNLLTGVPLSVSRPKIQEIDLSNNRLTSFPYNMTAILYQSIVHTAVPPSPPQPMAL